MKPETAALVKQIAYLPADWHAEGALTKRGIEAIVRHAANLSRITHTVETGCGKSTLLFSHLSEHHLVFTLGEGDSLAKIKNSGLLEARKVEIVEGPTQLTLPRYPFRGRVQVALIDGPHAYPFPDLEYYYFYPLLEEGGLLLLDDIKIPSIRRMFEVVKADDMFELLEISEGNLSIFRRTSAPCLDPQGDGWWEQGVNRGYYLQRGRRSQERAWKDSLLGLGRIIPSRLRKAVPRGLRRWLRSE